MIYKALARLLRRPPPAPRALFVHPNLGSLRFDPSAGTWESTPDMEVYFGGIPGDATAPVEERCVELLHRMNSIDLYWRIADDDLRFLLAGIRIDGPPKEVMRVCAMSLYDNFWEVCFETLPDFTWLYVGMQFEGDVLISNTIDT